MQFSLDFNFQKHIGTYYISQSVNNHWHVLKEHNTSQVVHKLHKRTQRKQIIQVVGLGPKLSASLRIYYINKPFEY